MTGVQNDAQVEGGLKASSNNGFVASNINGRVDSDINGRVDSDNNGGVANKEVTLSLGNAKHTSALGYRLHLGPNQPSGGSLLWRVHRPQTLNLEPKLL